MEYILEEYGIACLGLLSGAILIALLFSYIQQGGMIYGIVVQFIQGICG